MSSGQATTGGHRDVQPPASSAGAPAVDVEKLADIVYRLLLADLRLALARGDQCHPEHFGARP